MDIKNEVERIEKHGLDGAILNVVEIQQEIKLLSEKLHVLKMLALIKTVEENLDNNSFKKGYIHQMFINIEQGIENEYVLLIRLELQSGEVIKSYDNNATRARLYEELVAEYSLNVISPEYVNMSKKEAKIVFPSSSKSEVSEQLLSCLMTENMKKNYEATLLNYHLNEKLPQKPQSTTKYKV